MKLLGLALAAAIIFTILVQSTVMGCWVYFHGSYFGTHPPKDWKPGKRDMPSTMWTRQERENEKDTLAERDAGNTARKRESQSVVW